MASAAQMVKVYLCSNHISFARCSFVWVKPANAFFSQSVSMELGGKSPIIVFEDVDLDKGKFVVYCILKLENTSGSWIVDSWVLLCGVLIKLFILRRKVKISYRCLYTYNVCNVWFNSCWMDCLWLLLDKWSDMQCNIPSPFACKDDGLDIVHPSFNTQLSSVFLSDSIFFFSILFFLYIIN